MASPPATSLSQSKNVRAGFFSVASFELMQRVATGFSRSSIVPKAYQNNVPNCMIAISIADRIGADPLMVMQSLHVIQGKPSWSAQFLIATANTCGRFEPIEFEFFGDPKTDSWGCRASAIEKSKQRHLVGPDVTIEIAKKEGWLNRDGSKWKTMPQLMLMYRAGAFWVRAFAPELSLGLQTSEEAADILDASPSAQGAWQVLEEAKQQLSKGDPNPTPPPRTEQPAAANEQEEGPPASESLSDDEAEAFGRGSGQPPQDGPAPAPPPVEESEGQIKLKADQIVQNAIANLNDPDFKTVEQVEEYSGRTRLSILEFTEIDDEHRMRLLGAFNAAVLDAKRRLMPKKK